MLQIVFFSYLIIQFVHLLVKLWFCRIPIVHSGRLALIVLQLSQLHYKDAFLCIASLNEITVMCNLPLNLLKKKLPGFAKYGLCPFEKQ